MKARLPKTWDQLSKRDKAVINQVMTDEVVKQLLHEEAELQKIWLKFACIILNRYFGFGRKRLLIFLGNWREMYRTNTKLDTKEAQSAFIDTEIDRIFRKEGYPTEYINKLEEI